MVTSIQRYRKTINTLLCGSIDKLSTFSIIKFMETTLAAWLQSSQDSTQVANKVKGAILAASSLIIFFGAQFFHIQLSANDVITLATEIGTLAGAIWAIYGCILHLTTWAGTVKKVSVVPTTITPSAGFTAMPASSLSQISL